MARAPSKEMQLDYFAPGRVGLFDATLAHCLRLRWEDSSCDSCMTVGLFPCCRRNVSSIPRGEMGDLLAPSWIRAAKPSWGSNLGCC